MSKIQTFNFEQNSVRVFLDENNNPLFVAKDVATTLGYARPNDAIKQHCKGAVIYRTLSTKGGNQEMRVIYEPDVYRLIFGSKLDSAVKFQNWVFDDVLPTIRKTGSYRHTISIEQQAQIRQAVAKRCQSNSTHYQSIYTALHHKFGIPRYDELLAKDFDEALVFITDFKLADDVSEYNALWKLIGLLEYERIDHEIRELKRTIDTAYQQIERISRTKGLIYDAISEQRTSCPHNIHRLNEAKAFIARQMAMKQRLI